MQRRQRGSEAHWSCGVDRDHISVKWGKVAAPHLHCRGRESPEVESTRRPCLQLPRVTGALLTGLLLSCASPRLLAVWPCVPLRTSPQSSVLGTGRWGCAGIMVTLFLSYSCLFLSRLSVCPSVRLSVSLQAFL